MREFDSYLRANAERIPHCGERRRAGEAISTAFVESAVNQVISKRMVKKQQMRWSPRGAHLLLQVRTRVLNNTLTNDYQRWYPQLHPHPGTGRAGRSADGGIAPTGCSALACEHLRTSWVAGRGDVDRTDRRGASACGARTSDRVAHLLIREPPRRALDGLLATDAQIEMARLRWLNTGPIEASAAAVRTEIRQSSSHELVHSGPGQTVACRPGSRMAGGVLIRWVGELVGAG